MAVIATIPSLTSSAPSRGPSLPLSFASEALRSSSFSYRLIAGFRPAGRLTFFACAKKVSKETHPGIRVSLRSTSLPPVPLRGPAYKGHPCPFKPLAASMRLTPLRNTSTRPTDGELARMRVSGFRPVGVVGSLHRTLIVPTLRVGMQPQTLRVCGTQSVPGGVPTRSVGTIEKNQRTPTNPNATTTTSPQHQKLGPRSGPVSRLSGIVEPGVERHGCRESRDGPGMALRGGPLEQ